MATGCLQIKPRDGQELSEHDWQELHKAPGIITASEVATILGVNPYKSPFTLWAEKTGQIERSDPGASLHVRIGKALEYLIADEYQSQTGRPTRDPGDYTVWQHGDAEWLYCTPDRFALDVSGDDDQQLVSRAVELKWGGDYTRRNWDTDNGDAPLAYQVQNQIQMACVGLGLGSVAGIIGGKFINTDTTINPEFVAVALNHLEEFRDQVLTKTAPPVDGSENTYRTLKALHPRDNGSTIILDTDTSAAVHKLKAIKEQIAELAKEEVALKNAALAAIGGATFAQTCDGALKLSCKHFERAGYVVGASEGRTLRFVK